MAAQFGVKQQAAMVGLEREPIFERFICIYRLRSEPVEKRSRNTQIPPPGLAARTKPKLLVRIRKSHSKPLGVDLFLLHGFILYTSLGTPLKSGRQNASSTHARQAVKHYHKIYIPPPSPFKAFLTARSRRGYQKCKMTAERQFSSMRFTHTTIGNGRHRKGAK